MFLNSVLVSVSQVAVIILVASPAATIRGSRPEIVMVCMVVMAVPSVLLYLGLQRFLGSGMTAGAVKG
jgi:ABC-type glycerol-3-phosphate transport system permease component